MTDHKEERAWVGFDLGGTKMLAVVYDSKFRPLGRKRKKSRKPGEPTVQVERVAQTIREAA